MTIDSHVYRVHRLIWLWMTGTWPKEGIDHINGVRDDNRWVNIREADVSVNNQNHRKAERRNKTGLLGVSPHNSGYRAVIYANRKRHFLGTYKTPELAHAAYITAKRKLHQGCTI